MNDKGEIERERALRIAAEREAKFQRARAELLAIKLEAMAPIMGKYRVGR